MNTKFWCHFTVKSNVQINEIMQLYILNFSFIRKTMNHLSTFFSHFQVNDQNGKLLIR